MLTQDEQRKLIPLKNAIVSEFNTENWMELAAITGCLDIVRGHARLLRSLDWGDPDYAGNVLQVLVAILERSGENLQAVEHYINTHTDAGGESVSSTLPVGRKIYFTPSVFTVPEGSPDRQLVSAMMPFDTSFRPVYGTIKEVAERNHLRCQRADDIWESSALVQDIFALIWRSHIVICDFSGRNPNVFYEAGIAHTLGKHVVPITQNPDDVPFDLRHHRYIRYLNNAEGRTSLAGELDKRLTFLANLNAL